MADIEKVIKGLETCIPMKYETNEEKECRHEQCPYGRENYKPMSGCFWDLMSDALALLKEQDGKQDGKPMIENEIGWNCPSCGMNLIGKTASGYPCDLIDLPEDEPINFCPKCGQAVKWE